MVELPERKLIPDTPNEKQITINKKREKNMKELLTQYAAYNLWAHQKMIDAINLLNEEQVNQEITSSFPSIFKTVLQYIDPILVIKGDHFFRPRTIFSEVRAAREIAS